MLLPPALWCCARGLRDLADHRRADVDLSCRGAASTGLSVSPPPLPPTVVLQWFVAARHRGAGAYALGHSVGVRTAMGRALGWYRPCGRRWSPCFMCRPRAGPLSTAVFVCIAVLLDCHNDDGGARREGGAPIWCRSQVQRGSCGGASCHRLDANTTVCWRWCCCSLSSPEPTTAVVALRR